MGGRHATVQSAVSIHAPVQGATVTSGSHEVKGFMEHFPQTPMFKSKYIEA